MQYSQHIFKASKQKGFGFFTAALYLAVFVYLANIGFKSFLAYSEYWTVNSTLKSIFRHHANDGEQKMRKEFDYQAQKDSIQSVKSSDLVFTNSDISVKYKKIVPLYVNVSLQFDFSASSNE